jgi:hypothetical protein
MNASASLTRLRGLTAADLPLAAGVTSKSAGCCRMRRLIAREYGLSALANVKDATRC